MTNTSSRQRNEYIKRNYPALWLAINHHRTHNNQRLTFHHYEYMRALYLDPAKFMAIIKGTQSGLSEWFTVLEFAKALMKRSIFHVLPTGSLKNRYVQNRVDRSIAFTPFYQDQIQEEDKRRKYGKDAQSLSLKHFGGGTIAYVGSNSASAFTEYPADDLFIDEEDQCDQKNILMGPERLANSSDPNEYHLSNPTIEGYGIDAVYSTTDMKIWHIKGNCGHYVKPDWFETIVRQIDDGKYTIRDKGFDRANGVQARIICPKCGKPVDRYGAGVWVRTLDLVQQDRSGYQIGKTFSTKTPINKLLENFVGGLKSDTKMERFYNADLGLAFTAAGAKITLVDIQNALGEIPNGKAYPRNACIAGIDVGKILNVAIGYPRDNGTIQVTYVAECAVDVEEVRKLFARFGVNVGVVDAQPEGHFVDKLKKALPMFACYYGEGKTDPVDKWKNITVGRTESLDAVKESIVTKSMMFPVNVESVPEFVNQVTAATRIFDPEMNRKRGGYRWVEGSKPDHYHHALNYMLIARRLLVMVSKQ